MALERYSIGVIKAAKRFFKKLLKGLHYIPRVISTDKLKSYKERNNSKC
jgi:transposase-like protein